MWFRRIPDINGFFIWKASLRWKRKKEKEEKEMKKSVTSFLGPSAQKEKSIRFWCLPHHGGKTQKFQRLFTT